MRGDTDRRHEKLVTGPDSDIDYSDIPKLDEAFWDTAEVVMPKAPEKKQISIKLDRDVLDYFREAGPGYQTRMNAVLRSFMRAQRKKEASSSNS